jgi:hypothetical protein
MLKSLLPVQQAFHLYLHQSLNVALGAEDDVMDDAEVEEVAHDAQLALDEDDRDDEVEDDAAGVDAGAGADPAFRQTNDSYDNLRLIVLKKMSEAKQIGRIF